ncbi:fumarylacetoacetate hydrolase-like protein 1 [Elsinoe australis]|uniref:Fumarylacetoacetate hydrolase-like protein 1 n=1 Tax=Elsinoe australis TaxID=40998 RepID=A0A4U7BG28_9PEZI|nr:fumarylacetoacetate hydrolase-like protein 1 [Elsinoe australis]
MAAIANTLKSAVGMSNLSTIRQNARKVVCIGRNYADHVTELNNQRPKQAFFFLKPSSSILLPGEGPVLRPRGVNMHFEVELGVVIGKTIRDMSPEDPNWQDSIDTYLLAIDMTARNIQEEAKKKGYPWDVCKGFDTFLPLQGPISKDVIKDPHDIELWLKVNGETKQEDSTGLMLFQIPRQLADISKVMTLEKGDIVLTGTPKGVGPVTTGDILTAGMRIGGKEVKEAQLEVGFEDKPGPYEYAET